MRRLLKTAMATFVCAFTSRARRLLSGSLDANERLRWLRAVVAAGFIAGVLGSVPLWVATRRSYPLTPVSGNLPALAFPFDYLLLGTLLLALTLAGARRAGSERAYLFLVVALFALLAALDQSRLQPWAYQYALMLMVLACAPGSEGDDDGETQRCALNVLAVILASVYFWSGVQKLNTGFTTGELPALVNPFLRRLPGNLDSYPRSLGFALGITEAAIGVGLLIRSLRRHALALACLLHLGVLAMLVALNRNSVVWAWNVAMIVIVLLLFRSYDPAPLGMLWRGKRKIAYLIVITLCGVLPLLSFFHLWDSYLSWALYSGNTTTATVRVSDEIKSRLRDDVQRLMKTNSRGEHVLYLYHWSMAELNVPPYPEPRVYRSVARELCHTARAPSDVRLTMREHPRWHRAATTLTTYDCSDLD